MRGTGIWRDSIKLTIVPRKTLENMQRILFCFYGIPTTSHERPFQVEISAGILKGIILLSYMKWNSKTKLWFTIREITRMQARKLLFLDLFLTASRPISDMQIFDELPTCNANYSSVPHIRNIDLRNTDTDFQNNTQFYKKLDRSDKKFLSYQNKTIYKLKPLKNITNTLIR